MITFKQHPIGLIFARTTARGRYQLVTKSEVRRWFPLIFETVKDFNVHTFNKAYGFDEEPVREGTYDGVYWYNS